MRISDWSSDVCSSDLRTEPENRAMKPIVTQIFAGAVQAMPGDGRPTGIFKQAVVGEVEIGFEGIVSDAQADRRVQDRKSVGSGKGGSVTVGPGGRTIIKKHNRLHKCTYVHKSK